MIMTIINSLSWHAQSSLAQKAKQQVNHGTLSHQANHIVHLTRPLSLLSGFFSSRVLASQSLLVASVEAKRAVKRIPVYADCLCIIHGVICISGEGNTVIAVLRGNTNAHTATDAERKIVY